MAPKIEQLRPSENTHKNREQELLALDLTQDIYFNRRDSITSPSESGGLRRGRSVRVPVLAFTAARD